MTYDEIQEILNEHDSRLDGLIRVSRDYMNRSVIEKPEVSDEQFLIWVNAVSLLVMRNNLTAPILFHAATAIRVLSHRRGRELGIDLYETDPD